MTVLAIRSYKRHAVRQIMQLAKAGHKPVDGLMIELSSEGCRISSLGRAAFVVGEAVSLEVNDQRLKGHIRWFHNGIAGVRFDQALFNGELSGLIACCRGEGPVEARRYGTSG
ncbi:PilZ domain-containing protein [Croceibacterium sp. LX-88]|jgi:hypothetical protein|uniref:PilZ domain-containing protein n=1 Tax=Croceibacterium selenioxidans TaxID=2838833 RepID=A0ABS5W2E5_9SPHN|nr:PilZ domain-containing protein [Croceibacterium selenioxidans]MBT2133522.1 PilZ domain-containing protein [Croceibacterium selenioxidans]